MKRLTTNASDKPMYDALGIPETATPEEIHEAFLRIARQHHPDIQGSDKTIFDRARYAHDVLMDANKRAIYDSTGLDPQDNANKNQINALALIQTAAQAILNDGDADINIVKRIQGSIERDKHGLQAQLRQLENALDRTEKMLAKVDKRWKGSSIARSAVLSMLKAQIDGLKSNRVPIERAVETMQIALDLMADSEYEMPNVQSMQFPSALDWDKVMSAYVTGGLGGFK